MQMKRKRCGLFRTTTEISNTDLQETRTVPFLHVENGQNRLGRQCRKSSVSISNLLHHIDEPGVRITPAKFHVMGN